jgi:hypothetical protein
MVLHLRGIDGFMFGPYLPSYPAGIGIAFGPLAIVLEED